MGLVDDDEIELPKPHPQKVLNESAAIAPERFDQLRVVAPSSVRRQLVESPAQSDTILPANTMRQVCSYQPCRFMRILEQFAGARPSVLARGRHGQFCANVGRKGN